ncbi:E3 ubiquitin-protein ligase TRIM39-like [Aquarana catesbeiana]|uniref:E3 ubiquitin-protein ligase TRIM39-like n=1 Tax=Aquarana catesbeiana TaxID=8400 RepID=UPI003CC94240
MATSSLREELNCSICLSLYKEPVSLKCGHIYCRDCIVAVLNTQETSGVYFCPECREEYAKRPTLKKNRKLCNIVDNYRSDHPEDTEVFCTYCDHFVPATKTCLHCEASFCKKHLKSHSKSAEHILTDPTKSFEDRKCSIHKEILKYHCSEDNACICMSCWVAGEHRGHQVELLDEASEKTKEKLDESTKTLDSEKQEIQRRIQNLENHRKEEKEKAVAVTKRVTELFRDIRKHLDDVENRILTEVSRQEGQITHSVSKLIPQLEQQKDQLSRKIEEMKELCNIQDPIMILKKVPNKDNIFPGINDTINDVGDVGHLNEGIISQMLHRSLLHFTDSLVDLKIKRLFSGVEKSDILLDINTAHKNFIISEDLRTASCSITCQNRPDGPERFESKQILSTNSFTSGKHYWEVDLSGADKWLVGVVGHSIERKIEGNESYIGYNDKSWGLAIVTRFVATHNNKQIALSAEAPLKIIGIYLDYDAGRLSFYQLCGPVRHLYTFNANFTEPLHAAFYVFDKCSIRIKN